MLLQQSMNSSPTNKLGLGTVQFGLDYGISNQVGKTSTNEVGKILDLAKVSGIDTIDTAQLYGDSEAVLGLNDLSDFNVITKFVYSGKANLISEVIPESLRRLNVKSLYGVLVHQVENIISNSGLWDELKELKKLGTVEKIGVSFNSPIEIDRCLDLGIIPEIAQMPYNYLDNRYISRMKLLKSEGCEIHTRSSFLQGLFFKKSHELPSFFNEVKPILHNLQKEYSNLPLLLLKYCMDNPLIDKVIIGVENREQLNYNLQTLKINKKLPSIEHDINEQVLTPSMWPKIK